MFLFQGMFLVRESVHIPGSFVLSLIHNHDTQHFQISTSPHSGCFSIDNGPQFVGLDQLISFYRLVLLRFSQNILFKIKLFETNSSYTALNFR